MGELLHHNSGVLVPREEYEELTEAVATVFRLGARFLPSLVERLDLIDGDPDIEANGDELDGSGGEDDFTPQGSGFDGPGCALSDPDIGVDDEGEQATWAFNEDQHRHIAACLAWHHDDAEEDNEDCGQDEGEPDMRSYVGEGPGCPISDSDVEHDGRERDDGF